MELVLAHNVIQGGGVNVVKSFLLYLKEVNSDFLIVLPRTKEFQDFIKMHKKSNWLIIWTTASSFRYFYRLFLKSLINIWIRIYKVNKIYVLGNIAFNVRAPQALLVQNAFSSLNDEQVWSRFDLFDRLYLKLMQRFILGNLRYAAVIIVQTRNEQLALSSFLGGKKRFLIAPNSINFSQFDFVYGYSDAPQNDKLELLFLSKYYPHKNFEILEEVANLIRVLKLPITITLTLDAKSKRERRILKLVDKYNGILFNIGSVNYFDLPKTYLSYNGVFLPTLLESFSGNYIEAMFFKKLIFTSDKSFAREICRDSAIYFDPLDPLAIITSFQEYLRNPKFFLGKLVEYDNILKELNVFNLNYSNKVIYESI